MGAAQVLLEATTDQPPQLDEDDEFSSLPSLLGRQSFMSSSVMGRSQLTSAR